MNPAARAPSGTRVYARPLFAAAVAAIAVALAVAGHAGNAEAATVIFSWEDLMGLSDLQDIRNFDDSLNVVNDFTVIGTIPTDGFYELGGFISSGGGLVPVAYLKNFASPYTGFLGGAYDRATLGIGAYPTSWIAVHMNAIDPGTGDPYIGILDGSNFTIAAANEFWGTDEIEFNGILDDYAQMPATTTSGTLQIPSINITPEPGTLALLAGGVLALLRRRRKPALPKRS
ncbi:MAG TPA: PEP-CTERM sorting domain-containing protein [Phycisphaerae bacterium]|nr:PEP-CTERM sorting domain-containing protein [Phycisphaerae bacterium]